MQKIENFRLKFSFGIASILVPMAYIFRSWFDSLKTSSSSSQNRILQYLVANEVAFSIFIVFLFVFSLNVASWGARKIVGLRRVRAIILGRHNVEGYWHTRTEKHSKNKGPVSIAGIAFMAYQIDTGEFKVETTRYDGDRKFITQSEIAYVRTTGSTIRYLNFFRLTYPDPEGPNGYASGKFSYGDHFAGHPMFFEAVLSIDGGNLIVPQFAERIPERVVSRYQKKHGEDWKKRYLTEHSETEIKQSKD